MEPVEVTPDLVIYSQANQNQNEAALLEFSSCETSPPSNHFPEEQTNKPFPQNSLLMQMLSCPTFIFPALDAIMSSKQLNTLPVATSPSLLTVTDSVLEESLTDNPVTPARKEQAKKTVQCEICLKVIIRLK